MADIQYGSDAGAYDPDQATTQPEYTGSANEDAPSPAMLGEDATVEKYMAERREALAKQFGTKPSSKPKVQVGAEPTELPEDVPDFVEDPDEPSVEEVMADAPAEEPEAEPEPEELGSRGKQVRALLARERAAREQQKAIEAERAELAELKAQLEEFKRVSSRAQEDPLAVLRALGVTDDSYVADQALNSSLGDLAPEDWKRQQETLRAQREAAEAKAELERYQAQQQQAAVNEYWKSIDDSVSTLNVEQYPVVDRLLEVYGDQRVVTELKQMAQQAARTTGVATPEQLIQQLEAAYAPLVGAAKPAAKEAPPKRAARGNKKSLRNNLQQAAPRSTNIEDLSPEEQNAIWRQRFWDKING